MDKLTGFVTIARKCGDEIGEAVAYTKDGKWFEAAVVTKTPIFDSNEDYGDVWYADDIYADDEVRKASDEEITFFKLRVGTYSYNGATSSKDYLESHAVPIHFRFEHGNDGFHDKISMVSEQNAKRACKMAVKELAEKLLEMNDINLAADMLGRIRDEYV